MALLGFDVELTYTEMPDPKPGHLPLRSTDMMIAVTSTTGPAFTSPGNPPVVDGLLWIGMVLAGLVVLHAPASRAARRGRDREGVGAALTFWRI